MTPSRKNTGRIVYVVPLLLLLAAIACNLPSSGTPAGPPTPYIIYVTATPEGYVAPPAEMTPTQPLIGPFQHTIEPGQQNLTPAPTLDLSGLTLFPTPTQPGEYPALTGTLPPELPPPTITPTPVTPVPTATPTSIPPTPTPKPPPDASVIPLLGINFISSAQHPADKDRVKTGLDAGAEWDRFAIYWSEIEQVADTYDWDIYDRTVHVDAKNGLSTDAILIGTPRIYADSRGVPANIYEPVFSDGTDTPGPGKKLNPDNPWGEFVYAAVSRYKPGGTLARQKDWQADQGVRVWEIWNEPDFRQFWQGSVDEYARLLKVAYIAVNHADPHARVMVGGMVLFEQPYFFAELLSAYKNDPYPVDGRYPFDIVGVHAYSSPPHTFYVVQRTENLLTVYGLGHVQVWLNESGVAVWDDYPGPQWATRPDQIVWRATLQEQADYVLQSAAYAFMGGAEAVFHFQLYDDCGNQPAGTTFSPHNGDLCNSQAVCWGDALGLLRNKRDNTCFNRHPEPGTPRPSYNAFRTVKEVFTTVGFVPLTSYSTGPGGIHRLTMFARPSTSEIITVLWSQTDRDTEAVLPARSERATLITSNGVHSELTPGEDGAYHILLPRATNRNQLDGGVMIGGPTVILIEKSDRPVVSVLPLLDDSAPAFQVKWRSSDPTIDKYQVWYRDDTGGGDWVLWFETDTPGDALFVGGSGRRYSFFARGQIGEDEWTAEQPVVHAWTRVE